MSEKERLASDEELILALAAGATVTEAAQRAGVGKETVYQRLNDVGFQRAVSQARGRAFDAVVGKLAGLAAQAVGALERVLQQGSRCEAMRAAKIILELGPRLRAASELEQRIAALEAEERKARNDQDALAKAGRGTGAASGRLPARLDRLEAQRAERNADGRDVADHPGHRIRVPSRLLSRRKRLRMSVKVKSAGADGLNSALLAHPRLGEAAGRGSSA